MNPNVTYNSYYHNHNPNTIYRVNPSVHSGLSMDTNNNNGGPPHGNGGGIRRSMTRNSYLSYASTPSWVNPSTMMDPSPARASRPLPDPRFQHGYGEGRTNGSGPGPGNGHGHGHESSAGLYITNVTEDIEEEDEGYVDIPPPEPPKAAVKYGYPSMGYGGQGLGPSGHMMGMGLGMPVGMGPNGMGVPMERVPPPPRRRPLPIPGATQLRSDGTFGSGGKKGSKSFVGGFFHGLKRLPKTVLRYGSRGGRKRRAFANEEVDEGEEERTAGLAMMDTGNSLPQYVSNPATPTAGAANVGYLKMMQGMQAPQSTLDNMPGGLPSEPSLEEPRRHRNPSLMLTPPSGETLRQVNLEHSGYFQSPEQEPRNVPLPAAEYPPPSLERDRTTVMMYHAQRGDTSVAEASRPPTRMSEHPGSTLSRRATPRPISPLGSENTSQHGSNERAGVATPAPNPINMSITPPRNVQSPVTAHPGPTNDYLKMTTSPRTATQATEVTEYSSYTEDPSFSSELNPVFRFFHMFYHLPWISERSTVDYSPMAGFGGKGGGRGVVKKSGQSWYKRRGERMGVTSMSLDLLSNGGEGDTGSVLSPLGGWRRRIMRRNTVENVPGRSRRHHRHHHHSTRHGHGHGHSHSHSHSHHGHGHAHGHRVPRRHRYRRRSTSTITFEEYHHQRNPSPMIPPMYPYPFASPPYHYFQAFPAAAAVAGSPAQQDTSTAANQGTPAGASGATPGSGNQPPAPTPAGPVGQSQGGPSPRGPRGPWGGGRPALYPHGYAAYGPPPGMFGAPMFMTAGYGEGGGKVGGGTGGGGGIVYMPMGYE